MVFRWELAARAPGQLEKGLFSTTTATYHRPTLGLASTSSATQPTLRNETTRPKLAGIQIEGDLALCTLLSISILARPRVTCSEFHIEDMLADLILFALLRTSFCLNNIA